MPPSLQPLASNIFFNLKLHFSLIPNFQDVRQTDGRVDEWIEMPFPLSDGRSP